MKTFIITLALISISASTAFGQDTLWTKTYGGGATEEAYCIQQTSDGGYIIAGYTFSFGAGGNDFYLVRTDPNGDTLWTRTYGGSLNDQAYSVQQTPDDGFIVVGFTESFGNGNCDFYLVKTDPNGDTVWTQTFGGSEDDRARAIVPTGDGSYIVAGYTLSYGAGNNDIYMIKIDDSGNFIWSETYGGSGSEFAYNIIKTSDDGYLLIGYTSSFGAGSNDFYIVKTDSLGEQQWSKYYGGTEADIGYSVAELTEGGFIFAGYTRSFGAGQYDFYLIKTDNDGDSLWTKTFGGTGDEFATSVVETDDGGFILSGGTSSFGAGSRDFYLVRTNSVGDTLWSRTYGGSSQEQSYSTRKTTDGAYVLAGQTSSFGAGGLDFWTVKIAELGYLGLIFEPDSFIFDVTGDSIVTREFSVYSDGSTTYIRPRCDSSWVSFNPDSVFITHGDTVTIETVFDSYGLDFGITYQTQIYFANSTPELNEAEIPVEMTTNAPIPITIEMIPDDPPIVVEPGGFFTYEGILNNNIGGPFPYPDEITVWINVEVRNIILGPIMRVDGIEVPPQGLHYQGVRQYVHSQALPGEYGYIAYCSTEYPEIMDSCFFNFTVVDNVPLCYRNWETYGWSDDSQTDMEYKQFLHISPNPFNSITRINYRISDDGKVVIEIFNLLGRRVVKLLDKWQQGGEYSLRWDASALPSGIYFCRMTIGAKSAQSKLILLK